MLISYSKNIIFIKTIKTGSSSIQYLLAKNCNNINDIWTPITDETGITKVLEGQNSDGWNTHDSIEIIANKMEPKCFELMFKIGVLRNPWDFAVSLFWWEARNGKFGESYLPSKYYSNLLKSNRLIIFDSFNEWVINKSYWPDNLALLKLDNRVGIDHIIPYENILNDLHKLKSKFNFNFTCIPRIKINIRPQYIPYQDYYTNKSRRMIESYYYSTIDIGQYKYDNK